MAKHFDALTEKHQNRKKCQYQRFSFSHLLNTDLVPIMIDFCDFFAPSCDIFYLEILPDWFDLVDENSPL